MGSERAAPRIAFLGRLLQQELLERWCVGHLRKHPYEEAVRDSPGPTLRLVELLRHPVDDSEAGGEQPSWEEMNLRLRPL